MAELRERDAIAARALEFAILTAARTGEALGATWDEIDLDGKVWTVPAERMKAHREHRIPLSDRAVKILQHLPREANSPFIFPGTKAKSPLSGAAMIEIVRRMRPGLTVHGFRSSFRDWCAERTSYPREVAEMALAHTIKDAVEKAYRRGELFEKRAKMMKDWASYCARPPVAGTMSSTSLPHAHGEDDGGSTEG